VTKEDSSVPSMHHDVCDRGSLIPFHITTMEHTLRCTNDFYSLYTKNDNKILTCKTKTKKQRRTVSNREEDQTEITKDLISGDHYFTQG